MQEINETIFKINLTDYEAKVKKIINYNKSLVSSTDAHTTSITKLKAENSKLMAQLKSRDQKLPDFSKKSVSKELSDMGKKSTTFTRELARQQLLQKKINKGINHKAFELPTYKTVVPTTGSDITPILKKNMLKGKTYPNMDKPNLKGFDGIKSQLDYWLKTQAKLNASYDKLNKQSKTMRQYGDNNYKKDISNVDKFNTRIKSIGKNNKVGNGSNLKLANSMAFGDTNANRNPLVRALKGWVPGLVLYSTYALSRGMSSAFTKAMDTVESESLFNTTFGNLNNQARAWSEEMSKNLGVNAFETRKASSYFMNLARGMSLTKEKAMEVSTSMTELSYDFMSMFNIKDLETASSKLKSVLAGEVRPLKVYGQVIDEASTKMEAYRTGIAAVGTELNQQQKFLARYTLLTRLAKQQGINGDMFRTLNSPANMLRITISQLQNALIQLGRIMMIIYVPIAPIIYGIVKAMATLLNTIASFAQALFGIKDFSFGGSGGIEETSDDIAENIGDIGSAMGDVAGGASDVTKELEKWFSPLDEINNIKTSDVPSSGGGGGGNISTPKLPSLLPDMSIFDGFKNKVFSISDAIYKKIQGIVGNIKHVLSNFSEVLDPIKYMLLGIGAVILANKLATFLWGSELSVVSDGVTKITRKAGLLRGIWTGISGAIKGVGSAMTTTTVGLGIFIGSFAYLYTHSERFRLSVLGIVRGLTTYLGDVFSTLGKIIPPLKSIGDQFYVWSKNRQLGNMLASLGLVIGSFLMLSKVLLASKTILLAFTLAGQVMSFTLGGLSTVLTIILQRFAILPVGLTLSAAASNILTMSMRALGGAMSFLAANPLVLVLSVIGLLIVGMTLLNKKSNDTKKETEDVNKGFGYLSHTVTDMDLRMSGLTSTLDDLRKTGLEATKTAYEELSSTMARYSIAPNITDLDGVWEQTEALYTKVSESVKSQNDLIFNTMKNRFDKSNTLTEEEETTILTGVVSRQQKEKEIVDGHYAEILRIKKVASEEGRALYPEEIKALEEHQLALTTIELKKSSTTELAYEGSLLRLQEKRGTYDNKELKVVGDQATKVMNERIASSDALTQLQVQTFEEELALLDVNSDDYLTKKALLEKSILGIRQTGATEVYNAQVQALSDLASIQSNHDINTLSTFGIESKKRTQAEQDLVSARQLLHSDYTSVETKTEALKNEALALSRIKNSEDIMKSLGVDQSEYDKWLAYLDTLPPEMKELYTTLNGAMSLDGAKKEFNLTEAEFTKMKTFLTKQPEAMTEVFKNLRAGMSLDDAINKWKNTDVASVGSKWGSDIITSLTNSLQNSKLSISPNLNMGHGSLEFRAERRQFATGGIAMSRAGGIPATIAEAGSPEAVIPLNMQGGKFMANALSRIMPDFNNSNSNNNNNNNNQPSIFVFQLDGKEVARSVVNNVNNLNRFGERLIIEEV